MLVAIGHKGPKMRTATFLSLAIAASLAAVPARASAQAAELPCVGYATFERSGSVAELIGLAPQ